MNRDKKNIDKKDSDVKKSADAVETPTPPQQMDPSKNPNKESGDNGSKQKKK